MPEPETGRIRLSLPADPELRTVVEVAVAVVARRMGLRDTEVTAARTAVGDAFDELLSVAGDDEFHLELSVEKSGLTASARRGSLARTVTAARMLDADVSGPSSRSHRRG